MHNGESSVDKIREIINQTFSNRIILDSRLACEMSIINAINNELISKKDLLIAIQLEPNIFDSTTIKRMIDRGVLSFSDLEDIGIRGSILTKLSKGIINNIPYIEPFKKLERRTNQIYFWGLPNSGKTCALGAIMHSAHNMASFKTTLETNSQGYHYMNHLISSFNYESLPRYSNAINDLIEMSMNVEYKDIKHPITFFDFSGDILTIIYESILGAKLNVQREFVLDRITTILKDDSQRKTHVFVIEYDAEENTFWGVPRQIYLNSVLEYLDSNGILKSSTDSIYLLITKVDKIDKHCNELNNIVKEYVSENYRALYNNIEDISKLYFLRKPLIIPFSIGKVFFQEFVKFNHTYATYFLKELIL